MRIKLLSFLLIIIFCSCGGESTYKTANTDSVLVIDLLSEPESKVTKLSEFAEDVEYIPLQTTDSSLIGGVVNKIVTTDNSIYILNNNVILCFDIDGKFLFKLDKQGRGPEEYMYISDFDVSSDNKILTILSTRQEVPGIWYLLKRFCLPEICFTERAFPIDNWYGS